jgi:hypothetical protein
MSHKNLLSLLLPVCAFLLFGARVVQACSCGPTPTVLDSYEGASAVVITRVVSVEKAEKAAAEGRMSDGERYVDGVKSTRMLIEKVYKGSLKAGDEITFGQGGGADCIWTFSEESVGQQFLFYLNSREKNPAIWYGFGCGRSSGVRYATDDLLYLNRLDKVRGKTRISGTVRFQAETHPSVGGRKIRLTGANKTYEVKTDEHGVYEIYDLPAGKYLIEPETPVGWKVNAYYLSYTSSFAGGGEDKSPKKILIALEDKKHASLDLHFEIDNAVRGKVYDPHGKLMRGVCLNLIPAEAELSTSFYKADCTEETGTFEITEIPPGAYLLVVNREGKISSSEPFKTFYYPDAFDREKATVITIGAGEMLEGLNIHAPKAEETILIHGLLLYSDGKPVADEGVQFTAGKTEDNVEGDVRATTDANGRFSIRILKGLEGELYGTMYSYVGKFEKCPQIDGVIKKSGQTFADVKTSVLKIKAEDDLFNVELKYPFPGCRKAKISE